MEPKKHSQLKNAATFGAVTGFLLILFSVIQYLMDETGKSSALGQIITFLVMIAGIVVGTRYHRQNDLGGAIKYGRALGTGTLITIFSTLIFTFYFFIFIDFIDPSMKTKIMDLAEEKMIQDNPEMTDQQIEVAKGFIIPFMYIGIIFWNVLVGFVISLISSAFLQKKDNSVNEIQ